MSLSNTFLDVITTKLNIKSLLLNRERLYIKNLKNQIKYLKKAKENSYKSLSVKNFSCNNLESGSVPNLIVMYVVNISFSRSNTIIHLSDAKGNIKFFRSAGSISPIEKQRNKRRIAVSTLIFLLTKKYVFLGQKPIALHLSNMNSYKNLIVSRLKKAFYIRAIKSFNQIPFNGCRRKKLRHKKYTKKPK